MFFDSISLIIDVLINPSSVLKIRFINPTLCNKVFFSYLCLFSGEYGFSCKLIAE